MKLLVILLVILSFTSSEAQNCIEQKEVIKIILNENSLKEFFKGKNRISVNNSLCSDENVEIMLNGMCEILYFTPSKEMTNESLYFLEYESTKKIIYVELSLFNKNVVHSAIFKRNEKSLFLLSKWTTFIKSKD